MNHFSTCPEVLKNSFFWGSPFATSFCYHRGSKLGPYGPLASCLPMFGMFGPCFPSTVPLPRAILEPPDALYYKHLPKRFFFPPPFGAQKGLEDPMFNWSSCVTTTPVERFQVPCLASPRVLRLCPGCGPRLRGLSVEASVQAGGGHQRCGLRRANDALGGV